MQLLVDKSELKNATSRQLFPLECEWCKNVFYRPKHRIQAILAGDKSAAYRFCTPKCNQMSNITKVECECKFCKKLFYKPKNRAKAHQNHFCSCSCAAKYNNTHKIKGTRRSKLELWLEHQLTILYPKLEIHYARKDAIESELDIYIPSLKLAFELNGIFHYEPIYGPDKLNQIKNNDQRKYQACLERNIELCVIDVSGLKYFKANKVQKYLDIVANLIKIKLG